MRKNYKRAPRLLKNWRFYDKIWAWKQCVFRYWTKYGHETSYFLVKNLKKGHPIDLLGHIIIYFWENWRFLTKYSLDSRGFFMKILKKWYRSIVFLREWTFFWQNIDLWAVCFLENGRFSQNMGIRAMIFSWEIGKKGHPTDFFGS